MASRVRLELVDDHARVILDSPGRPLNTLGATTLQDFEEVIDRLDAVRGLMGAVVMSGRPGTFLAGADLEELVPLATPQQAGGLAARGQQLLERWAALPFPTVAAIHGAALGGGLEVALASTYRVATDDPATVLGLPEVQLGLLPALGGTYRLPRRVGLARGVEMLLGGRRLNAGQALRVGLVDEVVAPQVLAVAARRWLDQGARREPSRVSDLLLGGNPIGRHVFFQKARQQVERRTGGHYRAPFAILEAVETGYAHDRAAALAAEARLFGELAVSPVSRRLVGLFLATRELGGDGGGPGARPPRRIAVVGAGFMGSGIAAAAAAAGQWVRLVDSSPEALGRALAFAAQRFASQRRRRKLSRQEERAGMARLAPATAPSGLGAVELLVEAVVEDLAVKRQLLRRLETDLRPDAVLGSNTSTIPITELARGLEHPERVLGLHFFSPVHRMPLVEIIRHPGTSEEAVRRALGFVRSLGKTPIVVADGPGFYTSRILSPYLAQGGRLLLEGAGIRAVDRAARAAGFPVGPLELLDEVGIDVAAHAARTMASAFPDRMPYPEEFKRLVEQGRLGRKSGRGFYDYRQKTKQPDGEVVEILGGGGRAAADAGGGGATMGERLLWAMAVEAVRCLEEGILSCPRDGDVGAVLGLGFPPFLGGPFRFIDGVGAAAAVATLERLAAAHGAVFAPPAGLVRQAATGEHFHP